MGYDLNAVTVNGLNRVQVLRAGAAARPGSDATAGVINPLLPASTCTAATTAAPRR